MFWRPESSTDAWPTDKAVDNETETNKMTLEIVEQFCSPQLMDLFKTHCLPVYWQKWKKNPLWTNLHQGTGYRCNSISQGNCSLHKWYSNSSETFYFRKRFPIPVSPGFIKIIWIQSPSACFFKCPSYNVVLCSLLRKPLHVCGYCAQHSVLRIQCSGNILPWSLTLFLGQNNWSLQRTNTP